MRLQNINDLPDLCSQSELCLLQGHLFRKPDVLQWLGLEEVETTNS
jgi:hypothetical protein